MKDVMCLNYPIHANLIYVPSTWLLCYIDGLVEDCSISIDMSGGGGGETPSLRVSRYAPRFCPPFSASGRPRCPPKFQNLTMSSISFRSCWVPFRKPPFSGYWQMFAPQIDQIYPFSQILLGPILNFEWPTPTDFYPEFIPYYSTACYHETRPCHSRVWALENQNEARHRSDVGGT